MSSSLAIAHMVFMRQEWYDSFFCNISEWIYFLISYFKHNIGNKSYPAFKVSKLIYCNLKPHCIQSLNNTAMQHPHWTILVLYVINNKCTCQKIERESKYGKQCDHIYTHSVILSAHSTSLSFICRQRQEKHSFCIVTMPDASVCSIFYACGLCGCSHSHVMTLQTSEAW